MSRGAMVVTIGMLVGSCDYFLRLDKVPLPDERMDAAATPDDTMALVDASSSIDAEVLGAWSPPERLTELNTSFVESDASMPSDQKSIYFMSNRSGNNRVYRATRTTITDPFGAVTLINELVGVAEFGQITADANTFYYRSNDDIESASRSGASGPFSVFASHIGLSSGSPDINPGISGDELHAIISRIHGGGNESMYLHTRSSTSLAWPTPVRELTELDTPYIDSGASFGGNNLIVFHSDRLTKDGKPDLYIATRSTLTGQFSASLIDELSEPGTAEEDPFITPDLRTIIFTRDGELMMSRR